jgi:hypothetical protein
MITLMRMVVIVVAFDGTAAAFLPLMARGKKADCLYYSNEIDMPILSSKDVLVI